MTFSEIVGGHVCCGLKRHMNEEQRCQRKITSREMQTLASNPGNKKGGNEIIAVRS